jgi:hypothetical protein
MEVRHISSPPPAAPSVYVRAEHRGTCAAAFVEQRLRAKHSGIKLERLDAPPPMVGLAVGSGRTGLVATNAPTDGDTT